MGLRTRVTNGIFISTGKKTRALMHEQSSNPRVPQEELLMRLIRENAETEFGRDHHFGDIKTLEQYRENVPLTTYADYAEQSVECSRALPTSCSQKTPRSSRQRLEVWACPSTSRSPKR